MSFHERLRSFTHNLYINSFVALVLLGSSLKEVIQDWNVKGHNELSSHHGVALFAFMKLLKDFSDFLDQYDQNLELKRQKRGTGGRE